MMAHGVVWNAEGSCARPIDWVLLRGPLTYVVLLSCILNKSRGTNGEHRV